MKKEKNKEEKFNFLDIYLQEDNFEIKLDGETVYKTKNDNNIVNFNLANIQTNFK